METGARLRYPGRVASFDGERHRVEYDDGEAEALDLAKEKFGLLAHAPSDADATPPLPPPDVEVGQRRLLRAFRVEADGDVVIDPVHAAAGANPPPPSPDA